MLGQIWTAVVLIASFVIAVEQPGNGEELKRMVMALLVRFDVVPIWMKPLIPYIIDAIVEILNRQGIFHTTKEG